MIELVVLNSKIVFNLILATPLIKPALKFEKSYTQKNSRLTVLSKWGSKKRKVNFKQNMYYDHQPISFVSSLICLRKLENPEICDIRAFDFFELWEKCVLTDVAASIYDRKPTARHFDTINDIQWCLSLVKSHTNLESKHGDPWFWKKKTDNEMLRL